jgi:hypothetical protein
VKFGLAWRTTPKILLQLSDHQVVVFHKQEDNLLIEHLCLWGEGMDDQEIDKHFDGNEPKVRSIYDQLLDRLREFGDIREVPKQTSIHLDNTSGFAGVYTLKNYINLHFRLTKKIDDARIVKVEQLSARRFKHTVKLQAVSDIDEQLLEWLKDAYELAG